MLAAPALASAGGAPSKSARPANEPPFHLGPVTYNVPRDWNFPTLLKILPEAGISAVELRTTHAHGIEPSLGPKERAEARKRAADAGLTLLSLGTACEFHSPDAGVVRENIRVCREFVELAKDIGARGVKVRPNGPPEGIEPEKTLAQIDAAPRNCGEFVRDGG